MKTEQVKINRLPKSEVEILLSIPWEEIKKTYAEIVAETTKTAQVQGFRRGKAPKKLVEEKLDKNKIYSQAIQKIIPQYYEEVIKNNNLNPIISPKISLTKSAEGENWEIKILTCEKPKIELGNFKEDLKKDLKTEDIWLPGKAANQPSKDEKVLKEEKNQKIIQWLLAHLQVEISDLLLEEDINRRLANLIDQTAHLGLSVEQYLNSTGKTADQLKQEYRQQANETWKLELILNEISEKEKIVVEPSEIEAVIQKAPDEEKKLLESQKYVLASLLRRQKTLDFLTNL